MNRIPTPEELTAIRRDSFAPIVDAQCELIVRRMREGHDHCDVVDCGSLYFARDVLPLVRERMQEAGWHVEYSSDQREGSWLKWRPWVEPPRRGPTDCHHCGGPTVTGPDGTTCLANGCAGPLPGWQ